MELLELHDEERSSMGVGILGLSGMLEARLLRTLDSTDSDVSDGEGSLVTLLPPLVSWDPPAPPHLLRIPATGFEKVAGLCLSRLSRRAGEAWTRKVSNSACRHIEKLAPPPPPATSGRVSPSPPPLPSWSAQATPFSPSAAWTRLENMSLTEAVRALWALSRECCFLATSRARRRTLQ